MVGYNDPTPDPAGPLALGLELTLHVMYSVGNLEHSKYSRTRSWCFFHSVYLDAARASIGRVMYDEDGLGWSYANVRVAMYLEKKQYISLPSSSFRWRVPLLYKI